MILRSQNTNNPNKGPEYFQTFSISSSTDAGDLLIAINLTDMVLNSVERQITEFSIDAKAPTVTISHQPHRMMVQCICMETQSR